MTNKEISEWVEKDADAWSIDASALVAILIDFVQDNNLSKAEVKNLPIDVVSNRMFIEVSVRGRIIEKRRVDSSDFENELEKLKQTYQDSVFQFSYGSINAC